MANEKRNGKNEKMRKLAELKTMLEKKIEEAEANLENFKILLEFVNKTLLEKGFKRAEIAAKTLKTPALPPVMEYETVISLTTVSGELLANLHISKNSIRMVIAEDKTFNVKTPPFQQFLVERVLNKMRKKDSEAASKGEIAPNMIFSYELILDDEKIQEMVIKNLTPERLRELKSSIHWTLEKMYEKMKGKV